MEKYVYFIEETADVIDAIDNDDDLLSFVMNAIKTDDEQTKDELHEKLYDILFSDDAVTGNGSGSYTMNTRKADEYVSRNLYLLAHAFDEFGYDSKAIINTLNNPEYCDVLIRCYMLPTCIDEAIKYFKHRLNKNKIEWKNNYEKI